MINLILQEQVPNFKFVAVKFANSQKEYTYKTNLDVEQGDFAVVDAPSGLTVVTVVAIATVSPSPKYAIKWLVDVVDSTAYRHVRKTEQALLDEHTPCPGVGRL